MGIPRPQKRVAGSRMYYNRSQYGGCFDCTLSQICTPLKTLYILVNGYQEIFIRKNGKLEGVYVKSTSDFDVLIYVINPNKHARIPSKNTSD